MRSKVRKTVCLFSVMCLLFGVVGCQKATDPTDSSLSEPLDSSFSETNSEATVTEDISLSEVSTSTPDKANTTTAKKNPTAAQKTTARKTSAPAKTTQAADGPMLSDKKVSNVGCGFYCVNMDKYGFDTKWKKLAQSDYTNIMFCEQVKFLPELKACNVKVWWGVYPIYEKVRDGIESWQQSFDQLWKEIQDTGCADAVLGWYLDEPSDMAAVKELTKYAKEKYGKRFFICYTGQATDYNVYGGYIGPNSHINKDNVQYLTDIAVDHYWDVKEHEDSYKKLYKKLHEVKPKGCKMWYVGYTSASWELKDASASVKKETAEERIEHIRYMYDCLMKEPKECRGGLLYFAYDYNSAAEKLYGLWNFNELTNDAWKNVMAETIRIGREICTGNMSK